MILKFHIHNYLDKSKKWYLWHSLAASFTYRTLKSGLDLQCSYNIILDIPCLQLRHPIRSCVVWWWYVCSSDGINGFVSKTIKYLYMTLNSIFDGESRISPI